MEQRGLQQQPPRGPLREMTRVLPKLTYLLRDVTRKGFFHLLSANALIGLLGFGAQLLVAKFLTPLELGQIKTMQSFIGVATIVAGFGFNTSVLKLCSEIRPPGEKARIFLKNLAYTSVCIPVVLAILFALSRLDVLSPDRAVGRWMPLYMLTIPGIVYASLVIAFLQALKQIQRMAVIQVIIRLLGFVGLVTFTFLYGITGFVISSVAVAILALLPLWQSVKMSTINPAPVSGVLRISLGYAGWAAVGNAAKTAGNYMDILLLNYLCSDRVGIGYYGVATIFLLGMNQITATVQEIATPYFSEKSGNRKEFLRVLLKYERLMIFLSAGVAVAAAVVVPPFITRVYGADFAPAGYVFQILTPKYFFWSCYALFGPALVGLGKIKYSFAATLLQVATAIVCGYFLTAAHGLKGAAVAQVLSYGITLIAMVPVMRLAVRKHFAKESQ